jgi:hypothetical protein
MLGETFACQFCLFHQCTGPRSSECQTIFGFRRCLEPSAGATKGPDHLAIARRNFALKTQNIGF